MTTMWRLFIITMIIIIFADKSFEHITYVNPSVVWCVNDPMKRDHPLSLNESVQKLHYNEFTGHTTVVPSGFFKLVPNVDLLDIYIPGLQQIEPGAFQNLNKLTTLFIKSSHVSYIKNGIFDDCPNLEALYMSKNSIESIENDAFKKLTNLDFLDLANNQLEKVPEAVQKLSNLQNLNLNGNKIKKLFANNFNGLSSLRSIGLSGNQLQQIEDDAFKGLTNLKSLYLFSSKLENLNANNIVTNLPNLKWITLSGNAFSCTTLKKIIEIFENKKIKVDPGHSKSDTAINGIDCNN